MQKCETQQIFKEMSLKIVLIFFSSQHVLETIRVHKVLFHVHDKLKNEIQNNTLIFVFNTKMEMEIQ